MSWELVLLYCCRTSTLVQYIKFSFSGDSFIPKSPYSIEKNSYFSPKMLSQHDQHACCAQLLLQYFTFFLFCQLALTGILKSDAVISGQWYIFFSLKFRTSFIVCEAAKVWPGSKSVHFKNNTTQNLKLVELVSRLKETCKIPKIGFGRGKCYIHYHVLQI